MTTSDAVENVTDESAARSDESAAKPTGGGYVQPVVDVAALTTLLDGKYAEVRRRSSATTWPSTSRSCSTPRR